MIIVCDKCKCQTKNFAVMTRLPDQYAFCRLCAKILERSEKSDAIHMFLQADHGGIYMTDCERSMVEARIERAKGKSPWRKVLQEQT